MHTLKKNSWKIKNKRSPYRCHRRAWWSLRFPWWWWWCSRKGGCTFTVSSDNGGFKGDALKRRCGKSQGITLKIEKLAEKSTKNTRTRWRRRRRRRRTECVCANGHVATDLCRRRTAVRTRPRHGVCTFFHRRGIGCAAAGPVACTTRVFTGVAHYMQINTLSI